MSVSAVWFAVQDGSPDNFLDAAGLVDTGEADEFFEAEVSAALYPDGWYVVLAGDPELFELENLKAFSENARLVAAVAHEGTLFSLATEWRNGAPVWSVSHEVSDTGEPLITVDGQLPDAFEPVRQEYLEKLDGHTPAEIAFEAPLEVAFRITGFRADMVGFEEDGPVFTRLEEM
jgi:hypothetical protein